MSGNSRKICVKITGFPDVPENNGNGKCYIVKSKTGRELKLPRSVLDFCPGHVIMPVWLARKVLRPDEWV